MSHLPMREKYIDETVGTWFIFGHHPSDPNLVDINDGQRDVFQAIPKHIAEELCTVQAEFRAKLYALLT